MHRIIRNIPDDNLKYPVLLKLETGETGSGFHFRPGDQSIYLVTAKHVLFTTKEASLEKTKIKTQFIEITAYAKDSQIQPPLRLQLDLHQLFDSHNIRMKPEKDVVAVKIAQEVSDSSANFINGVKMHDGCAKAFHGGLVTVVRQSATLIANVIEGNDAFILGYPTSLGIGDNPSVDPEQPLLRKGIIAGKNKKNQTIIVDSPIYYGNSGGLVLEKDMYVENGVIAGFRISPIGIATDHVLFDAFQDGEHKNKRSFWIENSGYSIVEPMDVIQGLFG